MDLLEELREALKPLIDRGVVLGVQQSPDGGIVVYTGDEDH